MGPWAWGHGRGAAIPPASDPHTHTHNHRRVEVLPVSAHVSAPVASPVAAVCSTVCRRPQTTCRAVRAVPRARRACIASPATHAPPPPSEQLPSTSAERQQHPDLLAGGASPARELPPPSAAARELCFATMQLKISPTPPPSVLAEVWKTSARCFAASASTCATWQREIVSYMGDDQSQGGRSR